MNLPNRITLSRLAVTLVLFGFLVATDMCAGPDAWVPATAGALFILAAATDALDGHLARKLGQLTDFGRIADPVADKVIITGSLIFLSTSEWSRGYVPAWMTVTIVAREFLVTALRGYLESRKVPFGARWDGKFKMIAQCVAIPALFVLRAVDLQWGSGAGAWYDLVEWVVILSVWATLALTISSGVRYVTHAADLLRNDPGAET
jgi:CDP-diacylglycerol--glycerol-3-phosphate 3-phosphatidyltransferase